LHKNEECGIRKTEETDEHSPVSSVFLCIYFLFLPPPLRNPELISRTIPARRTAMAMHTLAEK
jgi:hypothetical protein